MDDAAVVGGKREGHGASRETREFADDVTRNPPDFGYRGLQPTLRKSDGDG
jgi:hypothetical protein